ncbi:WAT1-related protein At2g37460-like [Phalaenopsis equestris]|uniref:WAT1-related protein At2g37460-like n=1 Tax=Phalaenopsis equestris TaxID=78828 RepID=UPI0009E47913|nr:WAT1-related protein At2g37460-like [Phalaenopsis equestris]
MVLLQFGFACSSIIATATLKRGMNHFVLVVYRNAVAAVVLAPFAFWFERKRRPKLTPMTFLMIVGLAIMEPVIDQNFYYMGNKLTSASFTSSFYNILPAVTFIIALILRMEKLKLRQRRSQAKLIGTVVTVAGAALMILYRGPIVNSIWSKSETLHNTQGVDQVGHGGGTNLVSGTFMLLISTVAWSSFLILQNKTLEVYPVELSLSVWICAIGVVLNTVIALVMERGRAQPWIIGFDLRLLSAVYTGIICSGVTYYVQGKVMKERGPVFVTAFNPLSMIFTSAMGAIILAEEISLGRILGAIVIMIGLYSLIWGKSNDHIISSINYNGTSKGEADHLPVSVLKGIIPDPNDDPTFIKLPVIKN